MGSWDDVARLDTPRPWPRPASRWAGRMAWRDLLFLHARTDAGALQRLLPPGLELDRFGGEAWLSVVAFRMDDVALRGGLAWPGCRTFPELNVRTYVVRDGRPGVWFLSLDAAARPVVAAARRLLGLPYLNARMEYRRDGDGFAFACERRDRRAPPARFRARFAARGEAAPAEPGSLDHWLLERYALYTARRGAVARLEVHHAPYRASPVEADVEDALPAPWPRRVDASHHVREVRAVAWPPRRLAPKA